MLPYGAWPKPIVTSLEAQYTGVFQSTMAMPRMQANLRV